MPTSTSRPEIFIFDAEVRSALPVAESFARQGFRVVAGSPRRYCASFYSRSIRERVIVPDNLARPQEYVDFLLALVKRRRFEMIVPLGDMPSELVARHRDEFMRHTKLVLVPYETFRIGRDKVDTAKAAERCGVPIPRTYYPEQQSLDEIASLVEYPVLIKPAIASGARGIRYCYNKADLLREHRDVSSVFGRVYVQELIPHQGMQYKVDMMLDWDGTLLAGVVYAKLRYYPPTGGSSVLNQSVYHPQILGYATRVAQSIGWFGMCDFDFIHDVRDDTPKLMEINPRYPESFRMCEAAGVDLPRILYQMACRQKIEPVTRYKTGRYLRFLPGDIMWLLTTKESRLRTRPNFFNFFDSATRYQILSARDTGPIIGYVLENVAVLLNPRERQFRLRLDSARKDEKK